MNTLQLVFVICYVCGTRLGPGIEMHLGMCGVCECLVSYLIIFEKSTVLMML